MFLIIKSYISSSLLLVFQCKPDYIHLKNYHAQGNLYIYRDSKAMEFCAFVLEILLS